MLPVSLVSLFYFIITNAFKKGIRSLEHLSSRVEADKTIRTQEQEMGFNRSVNTSATNY